MAKTRTYLFATTGGFSAEGQGTTPKRAFCDATKKNKSFAKKFKDVGKVTTRYATFDRQGLAQTGVFPKKLKKTPTCK